MNKSSRIKCEADAYELPHVAELLKEYDLMVEAIGRVSRLAQDSLHPRHGAGGCGIYARELHNAIAGLTPESESEKVMEELVRESERLGLYNLPPSVKEDEAVVDKLIASKTEETKSLGQKWAVYHVDGFRSHEYPEEYTSAREARESLNRAADRLDDLDKLALLRRYIVKPCNVVDSLPLGSHAADLECLRVTQGENDKLKAEVQKFKADREAELEARGKYGFTNGQEVAQLREENTRLQRKIHQVQMELKEDGEMQDKLDKAFLEIDRLETELRFPECRRLETVVGMLEDEIRCSTAREVSLAEAANEAGKKCFTLQKDNEDLIRKIDEITISLRSERDEYRTRALRAEGRLDDISSAISGHLEDKSLRSTQE